MQVELQGWGETIRTWLADGAAAAPQALDAAARDRVFSARRYLLDYAWVSRLVGGQTPGLSIAYRRFARSLDEAAGLLLVSAGEALSQNNYSGDRLLLQAPASELSARADAAAAALNNLAGSVQGAFSPTAWPWGLDSYRKLLERLENAGHGDIRVLLQENGLRTFTDELVDRASNVTGDGLRGLAATHVVALERVRRLIKIGSEFSRESPPLAAFLSALQLFVDTFRGGTAIRLISLGRPLLSSAGLYTFGGPDPGTQTLQTLVEYRSMVSQLNDILFGTDLTLSDAEAQFIADTCLYSIDLAIDLYAVGVNPEGQGVIEQRAAAYGVLVWELLGEPNGPLALLTSTGGRNRARPLLPPLPPGSSWPPSFGVPSVGLLIGTLISAVNALGLSGLPRQILTTIPNSTVPTAGTVGTPALAPTAPNRDLRAMAQELAIVESRHSGLLPLVDALTPGNYDPDQILTPIRSAVRSAQTLVGGPDRSTIDVPPPVETTLVSGVRTRPFAPPQVVAVVPPAGPTSGGTDVNISGGGFTDARTVQFGAGNAASGIHVLSDTQMTATSPPGTGTPSVLVGNAAGTSPTAGAPTFSYLPQVTGVAMLDGGTPAAGPIAGGTMVTITGVGFTNASLVEFGPNAAKNPQVVSDTTIIATSPPSAVGGVDILVTLLSGAKSLPVAEDTFTYLASPLVTGLSPATGSSLGGDQVVISGSGFVQVSQVLFGRRPATQFTTISPTTVVVVTPPHGKGSPDVDVVTPGGQSSVTKPFNYT